MCVKLVSLFALCCWLQLAAVSDVENVKNETGVFAFPDDLNVRKYEKQNLMHHHHHHHHPDFYHNPDFHRNHSTGGIENFWQDTSKTIGTGETESENVSAQIPLEYIQNLNEHNVSDLLLHFVDGEDEEPPFIQDRFGNDDTQERSAATMPKGADCMPEFKTVKIASSDDPSILYIPQCTRVEQCGGCCKHDLLSCQPIKQENIPFKVYKTQYTGEKKLKFLGTEVVMVEKHNKCKCQCRVRAEHCTKFQEYRDSECACACVNYDEKKKCLKNNATKLWNPELCACQCRDIVPCSTGSYFDQNECRCISLPPNRRLANFQRRSFRSEPLPVVPLDDY